MVSKNNRKLLIEKNREEKQRFSIRKLSVGAASVLVGLAFSAYSGQTAQAAEGSVAKMEVSQEQKQSQETSRTKANQAEQISQMGGDKRPLKPLLRRAQLI